MIDPITLKWPEVIEFGAAKLQTLSSHLQGAKRVFFLCDPPIKQTLEAFISKGVPETIEIMISTDVVPEPPLEALERLIEPVRTFFPDVIVGIGGGSAMDMAKLLTVLFSGEQGIDELIGIDNVQGRHVKLIAVTTTSGTGSEVTPIAVVTDLQQQLKKGVVSPYLIPDVAIIDPELTLSLPASVTASTGMDAMTHCIEAYTNRHAHPIIDNFALEGIRLISANLELAVSNGSNLAARTAMALGSVYGGLCLGPVNTAATHALAYPLGGEYKIAHGVSNSVLLPFIMNFNLSQCEKRYANIADAMGIPAQLSEKDRAKAGIKKIRQISRNCGIPANLKELSIPESALESMAESAMKVKRLLDNNPRQVAKDDALDIFKNAYLGIID